MNNLNGVNEKLKSMFCLYYDRHTFKLTQVRLLIGLFSVTNVP